MAYIRYDRGLTGQKTPFVMFRQIGPDERRSRLGTMRTSGGPLADGFVSEPRRLPCLLLHHGWRCLAGVEMPGRGRDARPTLMILEIERVVEAAGVELSDVAENK